MFKNKLKILLFVLFICFSLNNAMVVATKKIKYSELRGPAEIPRKICKSLLKELNLENFDLLSIKVRHCNILNSTFKNIKLDARTFAHCTFVKCKFYKITFPTLEDVDFYNCEFYGCKNIDLLKICKKK
ncbi:hypothetical protein GF385_04825 [Candidatus Dependentiae bacterium]|nr:hypothetical protein [Candidatus Dependentiae bacterium]